MEQEKRLISVEALKHAVLEAIKNNTLQPSGRCEYVSGRGPCLIGSCFTEAEQQWIRDNPYLDSSTRAERTNGTKITTLVEYGDPPFHFENLQMAQELQNKFDAGETSKNIIKMLDKYS